MKGKSLLKLVGAICLAALIAIPLAVSCAAPEPAPAPAPAPEVKPIRWVIGHTASPGDNTYAFFDEWAKRTEQKSNGRLILEIHPSTELGGDQELIESAMLGTIEGGCSSFGNWMLFSKALSWVTLPGLIPPDKMFSIWDTDMVEDSCKQIEEETGLKIVGCFPHGYRQLELRRLARTPAETNGIKIRVTASPIDMAVTTAWGCSPTPLAWSELYTAVQQGVIDGIHVPVPGFVSNHFGELLKYVTMVNAMYCGHAEFVSAEAFYKLPPDLQKACMDAAKEAEKIAGDMLKEIEATQMEKGKQQGVTFYYPTPEEAKLWTEAAMSTWTPEILKEVDPDMLARVQEWVKK